MAANPYSHFPGCNCEADASYDNLVWEVHIWTCGYGWVCETCYETEYYKCKLCGMLVMDMDIKHWKNPKYPNKTEGTWKCGCRDPETNDFAHEWERPKYVIPFCTLSLWCANRLSSYQAGKLYYRGAGADGWRNG
jgi:hypothetical protein